ncbi:hypothetical protein [Plantactinospora sp. GCM10030261]|uniref:hypothetical protein n=1 Tax=Plantactinospora sp. GCM10030261 TaxID=3273420 RepID=UPI00360DA3CB
MRRFAWAGAVVLAVVLSGCTVGDIRRSPGPVATTSTSGPVDAYRVYRVGVPVPASYPRFDVRFADAGVGYALAGSCLPGFNVAPSPPPSRCPAVLLVTDNGGRSWQERRLPQPTAVSLDLHVRNGRLLVQLEPHGWYLSTDRGQSFVRLPQGAESPAARSVIGGRFQVCCDGDDRKRVVELAGEQARTLPDQPDLPDLRSVGYAEGRLVATGVRDGRPHAAVSTDRGQSWRTTPVPATETPLGGLSPELNGTDVWLVGEPADRESFPPLWQFEAERWQPVSVSGQPPTGLTARAIGGGWVLVIGPYGWGAAGHGGYRLLDWPPRGDIRVLDDGSVLVLPETAPDKVIWIGVGSGTNRRWTRVELVLQ